jgi:hypothetical protein
MLYTVLVCSCPFSPHPPPQMSRLEFLPISCNVSYLACKTAQYCRTNCYIGVFNSFWGQSAHLRYATWYGREQHDASVLPTLPMLKLILQQSEWKHFHKYVMPEILRARNVTNYSLLRCDDIQFGRYSPIFWRSLLPPLQWKMFYGVTSQNHAKFTTIFCQTQSFIRHNLYRQYEFLWSSIFTMSAICFLSGLIMNPENENSILLWSFGKLLPD